MPLGNVKAPYSLSTVALWVEYYSPDHNLVTNDIFLQVWGGQGKRAARKARRRRGEKDKDRARGIL
jgi:hypothetical protein